ncbi:MAG: fumarylacetoacetate hydrolase family protein, partial [Archaeoglobi archaeon]|nr:fumarylacetoacetate hydrolase family protein [Candidatus Mnemosynella sp.]
GLYLIKDEKAIDLSDYASDLVEFFMKKEEIEDEVKKLGGGEPLSEFRFLPPVKRPSKIICLGLNYRDHAEETGAEIPKNPLLFAKTPNTLIGHEDNIVYPEIVKQLDYEAELAFVIAKKAKKVKKEDALDYVGGYTIMNDVSARDLQFGDGQWFRGKSLDTFAPLGPWVVTPDEIGDPQNLEISLRLNGEVMQHSNTRNLIFGIADIIEFITQGITLEPGDVISTGTPGGVGFARDPPRLLQKGDVVEVEIEKIGVLRNKVV